MEEIKTGLDQYPEFSPLVDELMGQYIRPMVADLNRRAPGVNSEMPYKAQFTFEEIIKKMSELV
jgi:hypothetical protein